MKPKPLTVMTAIVVAGLASLTACKGPGRGLGKKPVKGPEEYKATWTTIDSGGGVVATPSGYKVSSTIGQPDTHRLSLAGHTVTGGFWTFKPAPSLTAKRPMPEDCATISPGDRCSAGSCSVDAECAYESHCVPSPSGAGGDGICYVPKTRYVSIARHPEQMPDTARRVRLEGGDVLGWVGRPRFEEPMQEPQGLWLAEIVETPHYEAEWPDVVHVTGCEIAPGHTYEIQAIARDQDTGIESDYSQALALETSSTWGDVVSTCAGDVCGPPNGAVTADDCQAMMAKFQGVDVAPIAWLDIAPSAGEAIPDQNIGGGEALACQGGTYPGDGPLGCP